MAQQPDQGGASGRADDSASGGDPSASQATSTAPEKVYPRRRKYSTRWSVRAADKVSRWLITVGGIGTIVAVSLVFVFLAYVVVPLVYTSEYKNDDTTTAPWAQNGGEADPPLKVRVDEYRLLGWALYPNGDLQVFRADSGELIRTDNLFRPLRPTGAPPLEESSSTPPRIIDASFNLMGDDVMLALEDGSLRYAAIGFETLLLDRDEVPTKYHEFEGDDHGVYEIQVPLGAADPLERLADPPVEGPAEGRGDADGTNEPADYSGAEDGGSQPADTPKGADAQPPEKTVDNRIGMVQRTPIGQFRIQRVTYKLTDPIRFKQGGQVLQLAHIPPARDQDTESEGGASGSSATGGSATGGSDADGMDAGKDGDEKTSREKTKVRRRVFLPGKSPIFVVFTDQNQLFRLQYREEQKKKNPLAFDDDDDDEPPELVTVGVELPFTQRPDSKQKPNFISLTGSNAKNLFVVWEDGFLRRYDLINTYEDPTEQIVEERNLLAGDDESVKITQIEMFLGNETLLVGDSTGRVSCWFTAQYKPERTGSADDKKRTGDNRKLFETHVFPGEGSQVTAYGISQRMRNLAVGYADGHVNYYQVTTEQRMFSVTLDDERPVQVISISPKADGMYIGTDEKLWRADIEEGHPEATLASLFLPVWYESYPDPIHMWQSSSATQDTEPKLGLMPLIFGTLKATFYSMIFGAPLALLAAIFTSEFLHPGVRARIKPIIELMASLPSVVLGFLAALVFAPEVTRWLASVLSSFFIFPFLLLLSAFIWQLLPRRMGLLLSGFRFPIMFVVLLATIPICLWLGGPVEMWLFGGDVIDWLKAEQGRGVGGWIYLLLPVSALAALGLVTTFINPWLRQASANWSRPTFAWVNLLKFVSGTVLAIAVAAAVAYFLSYGVGWDPRGRYSMIGNFDPRNSLVVGFVMGFAIIPIIYTIADDALNSVPSHLRSASLGAGATPWQTAMRIVIPTAMSGLFSAVMIGLGRAVGETMIVLMALGNTPIMEISLFNGARTLSANIAVELPEAVQYSTHYRTLFMCALVLFVMTFILNTVAEVVRLRFRKRAYQL